MTKATEDHPRGLVWGLTARLKDYDFAERTALLSHTQEKNPGKIKTDRIDQTAKFTELKIHPNKTKVMKVKNKSTKKMRVWGQKSRKHWISSILTVASQPTVTSIQKSQIAVVSQHRPSIDCRTYGNHQSCKQRPNLRFTSPMSTQFFCAPQKLGEPVRRLREGSKTSRDVVFVESAECNAKSVLPMKKLAGAQVSTTSWKMLSRGFGDGRVMSYG